MNLPGGSGGRSEDRLDTRGRAVRGASQSGARRRTSRAGRGRTTFDGRHARMWVAAASVVALILTGATPALAEGEDPGAAASQEQTPQNPAPDPSPATEPQPAAEPAPAPEVSPPAQAAEPSSSAPQVDSTAQAVAPPQPAPAAEPSTPQPPYLRWRVLDPTGTEVLPHTVISVQGPGDAAIDDEAAWQPVPIATVADNTGDPSYAGADLDPAPGIFLVKQLVQDADPTQVHDVAAAEHYRLRPVSAEGARDGENAGWSLFASSESADAPLNDLRLEAIEQGETPPTELGESEVQALEAPVMSLLGADGAAPPYVSWTSTDAVGALVGGSTFTIQGPRNTTTSGSNPDGQAANWNGNVATVSDCTSAPCWDADLDPDPGEFLVKTIGSHEVRADRRYRIQQTAAPAGSFVSDAAFHLILGTGQNPAAGQWLGNQTFDFGPIKMQTLVGHGYYQSSSDNTNPGGWYSSGNPCQACEIQNFTSSYQQSGANWLLTASWTRPNTEGAKGWSIEYTKAPERWGGADQGDKVPVPQPDRSQGGMVLFIDNSNFTVQVCTYTGSSYPGTCQAAQSGLLTSSNDGHTLTLNLPLSGAAAGASGCPPTLGSTGYLRSWTGNNNVNARVIQAWAEPVTVTPPSNCGTTTVKITKMGDRNGTPLIAGDSLTEAAAVVGVRYDAYASTSAGQPTGVSLGFCITAANGSCTIQVSNGNTNGVWVEETSVPSGWSNMPALGIGAYDQNKTVTPYRFRVAVGSGSTNVTRNVTADRNLPNTDVSNAWVNVRNNPAFPEYCGVSIAMVFDTSTSISQSEMNSFKQAAQAFVGDTALGGTPSKATMFRFSTTASTLNGGTPYDLSFAGSAASNTGYLGAANRIATSLPTQGDGFTNWDGALRLVKQTGNYDMVLFLTDGDPTTYGVSGTNTNTSVQFRMVEQAAMSANALKASTGPSGANTKIVGVGVGLTSGSDQNLKAITGPTAGDDYFLAANFGALQTKLQEIAAKNCGGTLTVVKKTIDAEGKTIAESAPGWEFEASTSGGAYIENPPGANVASLKKTTPATNFVIDLETSESRAVTVKETPQAGWTVESVSCAGGTATGQPGNFTVPVARNKIVTCTVVNREAPKDASITAKKVWVILGSGDQELFRVHQPANAGDGTLPAGISAEFRATGPAAAPATPLAWGAIRSGYQVNNSVTISETVTVPASLPGCAVVSQTLTKVNGQATSVNLKDANHTLPLAARTPATTPLNLNEFEVTNTVKCVAKLSLLKSVQGGDASPSAWTLTASGQGGPFHTPGAGTVNAGNTFDVAPGSGYALSEATNAGGPITYLLDSVQRCLTVGPGNACAVWSTPIDPSAITVGLGAHEIYRFVNKPAPLVAVPLTGGMSGDLFGIGGLGIAFLAALMAVLYRRRIRRQAEVR